jgi:hypothetical protein
MPLTLPGKNNIISVTSFTHAGAFSDLGVTEVLGGTYARQPITWGAASGGTRSNSAQIAIPIPAGVTVSCVGIWDALTAGASQSFHQIGSSLRGASTVTAADVFTSVGHGLTADARVFVTAVGGDALPAGLSATTLYFVRATGLTADAFTLSTTSGGAAVDVTAAGECAWYQTVPQTFAIAGNIVLPISTGLVLDLTAFG